MGSVGTSPSRRPQVVTAEFNSSHPAAAEALAAHEPHHAPPPTPVVRPRVATPLVSPVGTPVVDIVELVRSNRLFSQLATALRLTDDTARRLLRGAMDDASTHPGIITAEDIWFMMPRIESDVIARFVDQDASVRRDQLLELLRRVRYESLNTSNKKSATRPKLIPLGGGDYARFA